MFQNQELQNHLETASSIRIESLVLAEWNMNVAENISQIGNYRYRPTSADSSRYKRIAESFSYDDSESLFYTGATDADVVIDGGLDNDNAPIAFISKKEKERMLYSLEDCFGRFRPRSGINKLRYFENNYSHHDNIFMSERPRYYMADKKDPFKYWSSYRTEEGLERGIANNIVNGRYYIDDAAPYVVYKNQIPANRIVVKMQTNVGDLDLGPFSDSAGAYLDPFYGDTNKTTPVRWRIQYLEGSNWNNAISFDENSTRRNGAPIVGADGYLEIGYGLIIPDQYYDVFRFEKRLVSSSLLPSPADLQDGTAFLVVNNADVKGTVHIVINGLYESFTASYGWQIIDDINRSVSFVTDLTDPDFFQSEQSSTVTYREFKYLKGLRVVVETMNKLESTFDLIELSPRLVVDLSDKVQQFSVKKSASDLGVSGLPVGQLLAGTGTLELFDYDQAFFKENTGSIVRDYTAQNIQIKFYETVLDVNGNDFFIPIKTMYTEGFPSISNKDRSVSLGLRDLFFYFESSSAPQMLFQSASLSYAVSFLLDSIGFSNYTFLRNENEPEEVIPYFYIEPDTSVAEVLNNIARSTQSTMFFDEYNNFIVMSKGYIMPTEQERATDTTLYGTRDFNDTGVNKNETTSAKLANIVNISSQDNQIFNDGKIVYTTRYIQRSYSSIRQASMLDRDKTWVYKPSLIWEVSATENVRSVNQEVSDQSFYSLAAIPINSDLTDQIPYVRNHTLLDNIIDFGDAVYWLTRYNGYFYANGEVIKFDAVQYSIPGLSATEQTEDGTDNVWISSRREYQRYFSKLPFNGKIYPTGLVRIYSEPTYETIDGVTRLVNGSVVKHGRGQFGTDIVYHNAGLSSHWTSDENIRGALMDSKYIFRSEPLPETTLGAAGIDNNRAQETNRTGLIKNFLANQYISEVPGSPEYPATTQSSALVMQGGFSAESINLTDFVSYIYKPLDNKFKHFGTRLRIIGKIKNNDVRGQEADGAVTYFTVADATTSQDVAIAGASAGLACLINPETNNGYYFELAALTSASNLSDYGDDENIADMFFYKVVRDASAESDNNKAIPVKLWSGIGNILVDSGDFVGQSRLSSDTSTTIYDIAVEYEDFSDFRRFYLYVNNVIVATVDDGDPLPIYNNAALFIRGASRAMFENIYALTDNYSQNATFSLDAPAKSVFGIDDLNANESFRKYAMSGLIQSTYLAGLGPNEPPRYNIYFEEFGTIMREASYFNVRYDKAYPVLAAKIAPTFNRVKGYTVSGFRAGSYGAEFLIFNNTDSVLNLDSTSGNYLRIQGIAFTQQSNDELSVDEYFNRISNLSDPEIVDGEIVVAPGIAKEAYQNIKFSRMTHGRKEFVIDAPYIQSQDSANSLMSWLASKVMKKKKSVGLEIFAMPTLQLGDIVNINYKNEDGIDEIAPESTRFVVYYIEYDRKPDGPSMNVYLSEVV